MKILIDARPLQTYSRYRGIGRYVNRIVELFKEDNNIYFLFFKGDDVDVLPEKRILINTSRKGITFTDQIFLPPLLKKNQIDVFHSTAFALPPRQKGIFYISTIYDLTPLLFPQFSTGKNKFIFNRILNSTKKADRIIAISECTKNDLIRMKNIKTEKIKVIYPPVETPVDNFDISDYSVKGIPDDFVFYAGGFDGNKNVDTIIKAVNIFKRPLVVTGLISEERKNTLRSLLNPEYDRLLIFTGYLPDSELFKLYRDARIFLFPSLYEGFGYPPLEALASGTPSIVSSKGALEEVMGESALFLKDPLDQEELAGKVELLWVDASLRKQIVTNGKKMLKNYSVSRFREELTGMYHSLSEGDSDLIE